MPLSLTLRRRATTRTSIIRISTLSLGVLLLTLFAATVTGTFVSPEKKLQAIIAGRWPNPARYTFTPSELIAMAMPEIEEHVPGAVSQPRLQLTTGGATGSAIVNFDKLQSLTGNSQSPSQWLVSKALTGKQLVTATVEIHSGKGTMLVHLSRISVAGISLSGDALDFVVHRFLLPNYPAATLDRSFALPYRIDHVAIATNYVTVYRR